MKLDHGTARLVVDALRKNLDAPRRESTSAWLVEQLVLDDWTEIRLTDSHIGFGCKLWNSPTRLRLNCYREEETPDILACLGRTEDVIAKIVGGREVQGVREAAMSAQNALMGVKSTCCGAVQALASETDDDICGEYMGMLPETVAALLSGETRKQAFHSTMRRLPMPEMLRFAAAFTKRSRDIAGLLVKMGLTPQKAQAAAPGLCMGGNALFAAMGKMMSQKELDEEIEARWAHVKSIVTALDGEAAQADLIAALAGRAVEELQ